MNVCVQRSDIEVYFSFVGLQLQSWKITFRLIELNNSCLYILFLIVFRLYARHLENALIGVFQKSPDQMY